MTDWLDTHLHLLYPDRLHYDWTAALPAVQGAFHAHDYQAQAQVLGINAALMMEVDVREDGIEQEIALVEELAVSHSFLKGIISACRPEQASCAAFAERACSRPFVKGFRRVLHTQADDLSTSQQFRDNVKRLTSQGHPFDICMQARQLPLAVELAQSCPDTVFLLDHCGVPDVASQSLDPWRAYITQLAALPNMNCKVSGIIAYGDRKRWASGGLEAIVADLRPFVEHVLQSFGWQRVLWGSDFPVCNLTRNLADWRAVCDRLLQGCSQSQVQAFARDNATRIYKL